MAYSDSPTGNWFTMVVDLLRPVGKPGEARLLSAGYEVAPYINLIFFENELDTIAMHDGSAT